MLKYRETLDTVPELNDVEIDQETDGLVAPSNLIWLHSRIIL